MSIWWVNTGARFREQVDAKALWCPNATVRKDGSLAPPQWHWSIIQEVEPGELIVVGRDGYVEGIAVAKQRVRSDIPKPDSFAGNDNWNSQGWLLPIEFVAFKERVLRRTLAEGLFNYKAARSPFRSEDGELVGNQVYFAELPGADAPEFFERIRLALELQRPGQLEQALGAGDDDGGEQASEVKKTTREAIVQARVGQGQFRAALMKMWEGKCCATRLTHPKLLRASHILAWSLSSDSEKLDPFNGLLLSAAYDAAFDAHLITLLPSGEWQNVAGFSPDELLQAGLGKLEDHKVIGLKDEHTPFLQKHNRNSQDKWAAVNQSGIG